MAAPRTLLLRLECSACGRVHDAALPQGLCVDCARPLLARYDLAAAAVRMPREALSGRPPTMWRYAEVLPAAGPPVTLGEGFTPLLPAPRLGEAIGVPGLWIKEEGLNPTGSFKARGLSAAVTMARERGATCLALPTAGNAGLAAAAYAAAAGLPIEVFCPADTPPSLVRSTRLLGARVHLVDGLITDCGARVREGTLQGSWFDLSTLKEPYRVEGKKTMAYELAEQMGWRLPDVILYPTGGGTGLIGLWKGFEEMERMGWIGPARPRLVSVQAAGCAPIVRAFAEGAEQARPWTDAATIAAGLRVPSAVGDRLMLRALRDSGGDALAVTDDDLIAGARSLARLAGVLGSPEGGACVAAARILRQRGRIGEQECVVLFNTGSALAQADLLEA